MPRDVVPFYHYTSDEGLKGILKDGQIRISDPSRGDAMEGPGAYGTKYPPSTRTKTVAQNNWDGGWKDAIEHGKMKNYIRCEVPREEIKECKGHGSSGGGGGRPDGILVHPHGIDLSKYNTKIGKRGEHTVPKAFHYDPEAIRKAMYPDSTWTEPPEPHSKSSYAGIPSPLPPFPQSQSTWSDSLIGSEPHHSGHNAAGNYYEAFADGSYRYENLDGSTYVCDGSGQAVYTAPDGAVTEYVWSENSGDGGRSDGDGAYAVGTCVADDDSDYADAAGDADAGDHYGDDSGDGWDCGDDDDDYGGDDDW
mmetsp:Transcript_85993/g.136606  ORF Transcript_85993/g.136606 Transcript_85993/m.136606 type:complete len:307 (-) Transcript_85993:7-927(-)